MALFKLCLSGIVYIILSPMWVEDHTQNQGWVMTDLVTCACILLPEEVGNDHMQYN